MAPEEFTCLQSVVLGGDHYVMGSPVMLDPESRHTKQLIKANIVGKGGIVNQARPSAAPGASQQSSLVGQALPETTAKESASGETPSTPKRRRKAKKQQPE